MRGCALFHCIGKECVYAFSAAAALGHNQHESVCVVRVCYVLLLAAGRGFIGLRSPHRWLIHHTSRPVNNVSLVHFTLHVQLPHDSSIDAACICAAQLQPHTFGWAAANCTLPAASVCMQFHLACLHSVLATATPFGAAGTACISCASNMLHANREFRCLLRNTLLV